MFWTTFARPVRSVLFVACLLVVGAAPVVAEPVVVLSGPNTFELSDALIEPSPVADPVLWLTANDLKEVTGFELKPQGACRGEVCIPLDRGADAGFVKMVADKQYVNLTALSEALSEPLLVDAANHVWCVAQNASASGAGIGSAVAPNFTLPDRKGNMVSLSDFRGKKVLVLTWASWCGCSLDLPGWEELYSELKDQNFEIVAAAQDTAGEAAAGKFYDKAKATYTTLIDPQHTISSLYHLVNVPEGIWIDEEGKIVRAPEVAYSRDVALGAIKVEGSRYVAGIRDWVANGAKSSYVMTAEELKKRLEPLSPSLEKADACFRMAVYFYAKGEKDLANKYWEEAQTLYPDNWNYHRQEWSFTPATALRNWFAKVRSLGDKPYYAPLELPEVADPEKAN